MLLIRSPSLYLSSYQCTGIIPNMCSGGGQLILCNNGKHEGTRTTNRHQRAVACIILNETCNEQQQDCGISHRGGGETKHLSSQDQKVGNLRHLSASSPTLDLSAVTADHGFPFSSRSRGTAAAAVVAAVPAPAAPVVEPSRMLNTKSTTRLSYYRVYITHIPGGLSYSI